MRCSNDEGNNQRILCRSGEVSGKAKTLFLYVSSDEFPKTRFMDGKFSFLQPGNFLLVHIHTDHVIAGEGEGQSQMAKVFPFTGL